MGENGRNTKYDRKSRRRNIRKHRLIQQCIQLNDKGSFF